jgi:hypothetical protein
MFPHFPEPFSENGAQPVQILGSLGRLIGWARWFSDCLTVTDNTIVGDRPQGRLTRIAGRDVSEPDGHTVGKTFSRKELMGCQSKPSPASSAESASNPIAARTPDQHQSVDPTVPRMHKPACLQNGARQTGLGHWLPGFLRSNRLNCPQSQPPLMPQEKQTKSKKPVDASHSSRKLLFACPRVTDRKNELIGNRFLRACLY